MDAENKGDFFKELNKSETAKLARDQVLSDGRKVSRLVIDAEDRLGELLINSDTTKSSSRGTSGRFEGGRNSLPVGINKKESFLSNYH